jgi:phage shock protein A
MAINEEKKQETKELEKKVQDLETKKLGAVKRFKETNDQKYQDVFKDYHAQVLKAKQKIQENEEFIKVNSENLDKYKRQLITLQNKIEDLKSQEDQAVADIISSRQVVKLNEMLSGFSTDVDMQGIITIQEARKKAIANAKLSTELSGVDKKELDEELLAAGSQADEEFAKLLAQEENKTMNKSEERNL